MPEPLAAVTHSTPASRPDVRPNVELAIVLMLIVTAASLYIWSLRTSGLRAAIASLTAIPSLLWLIVVAATALGRGDFLFSPTVVRAGLRSP